MRIKHKYLKEIGVTPIQECFLTKRFSIKDRLRYRKFLKRYKETGVFPPTTWDMESSLIQWFYETASEYMEEASKVINLNYHTMEYEGKEYTQLELLKLFLEKLKYFLIHQDELWLEEEKGIRLQEIYKIWSVLSPAMWW